MLFRIIFLNDILYLPKDKDDLLSAIGINGFLVTAYPVSQKNKHFD